MQRVLASAAQPATRPATDADRATIHPPLARAIAAHGLLVGVAADMLLRAGSPGIGVPVWIGLLALALTSLTWRDARELPRESVAWLSTAVLFACGLAWRDSEMLQVLDMLAAIGALGMAAIALGNERAALLAERFRDTVWAAAGVVRRLVTGFAPLVLTELLSTHARSRWVSRTLPALRAAFIAGALLVVFGSLLRGADPIFASLVALPQFDAEVIISHGFTIGFFCWIASGWALGALGPDLRSRRAPSHLPFGLSALDITTALGTLNVLFAAFVLAQLGWFFGGEAFLHARTGLTAAQYARQGFFEMVWVVMLVVPLLVATRAALHPGRALERRHTVLALPLIALLGAIILSAGMRMQLYVHYYGLTIDRLYPMIFMGWLGFVLAWLAATVLQGRGRTFIAGVAISGLAVLAALNVAGPDVIVARFNMDRAAHASAPAATAPDLQHMAELGGEAAFLATQATLAAPADAEGTVRRAESDRDRCFAAKTLLQRWGPTSASAVRRESDGAWRSWNAGEARAVRDVSARSAELRAVQHSACAAVPRATRVR